MFRRKTARVLTLALGLLALAIGVATNLIKKSAILKHLLAEKKIKIVAAKYDLDDGIVTLFK